MKSFQSDRVRGTDLDNLFHGAINLCSVRISDIGKLLKSFIFDLITANQPNWASPRVMLFDNMPMKSKRPRPLSSTREARWRNKVKTWPNMSSGMADSSSDSTSSEVESEGHSSREASGADVRPKTWQEDDVKPNQEELREALNAGIRVPPEDSATVVLNTKIGKAATCLSSDNTGKTAYYPMQGGLHDGPGVSAATSSGDINHTGSEKPPQRRSFDCTVCGKKLFSAWKVQEHPDLGVGICRACYSFLFSSPYTKDMIDCSEEQCRWCGQGGRIVMCDECDKSFCDSCIVRNYGPKELARIVSSNWSCFCCDPELLRAPIDELKEFQNSARLPSETNNVAFKRKGRTSWAGQLITRDASEDNILGTEVGGATIAELLDQEEERRKQHKGMWTNSRRVKSTTHIASRKNKKAASSFHPALITKARLAATTEVKQEPWVATDKQSPVSATTEGKQQHEAVIDKQAPAPATTEGKQQHEVVIDKQAPTSATPATRTWIRPHQWEKKRKEAAERRKRAAEAELLKNVSDDCPKQTNSRMSEDLQNNVPCKEEDACPKMPTEIAHALSDAVVGNASKGKK